MDDPQQIGIPLSGLSCCGRPAESPWPACGLTSAPLLQPAGMLAAGRGCSSRHSLDTHGRPQLLLLLLVSLKTAGLSWPRSSPATGWLSLRVITYAPCIAFVTLWGITLI